MEQRGRIECNENRWAPGMASSTFESNHLSIRLAWLRVSSSLSCCSYSSQSQLAFDIPKVNDGGKGKGRTESYGAQLKW